MIPDGIVMTIRRFFCGYSAIGYFGIGCCRNGFPTLGRVLGDISRYSFPGNLAAQKNSREKTFPGRLPGIGYYFFTYDDTDLII